LCLCDCYMKAVEKLRFKYIFVRNLLQGLW
jgi:hypothetical protein